jgi:hypothetical protein
MKNIRGLLSMVVALLPAGVGCLDGSVVLQPVDGGGGAGGEAPTPPTDPRLDLLVVLDNSFGMAEDQRRFAEELGQLVVWLAEPPCMAEDGRVVEAAGSLCPPGSARPFAPVRDLHLGFVSSSLGDFTSGACFSEAVEHADDRGRLVSRGLSLEETYQGLGFLAYDPDQQMSPPGEADLDVFLSRAVDVVTGMDARGCGYEMPLESMTRFLVDPAPYDSLGEESSTLVKQGVDQTILDQRAAFLRDRSNLAVIVVTDEDDCSLDVQTQGHLAFGPEPFFRATSECASNANDPCCTSCALLNGDDGCDAENNCGVNGGKYTVQDDHPNLKCWDQKRRYGVDFLAPVTRYANALSVVQIDPSSPTLAGPALVDNPLFSGGRHPNQVAFLPITGVPWQDLVANPNDLDAPTLSSAALQATGQWDWFTGPTSDPFMRATSAIRSGTNPATGDEVSAANPINLGDFQIEGPDGADNLQRACTYLYEEPLPDGPSCSFDPDTTDPLCEEGGTQIGEGATPGLRHLAVARALGDRAVVGSACRDPRDFASAQALLVRLADVLP